MGQSVAAGERLALGASGQVHDMLKTPYRDGTTHVVLEPLELMTRLAALVPPPRMHLTRFHAVFAPHSRLRAAVTSARRGMGAAKPPVIHWPPTPRHVAMSWARRLERVFGIEIDACQRCCGTLRIIASIEQPELIAKILAHLERAVPARDSAAARRAGRVSWWPELAGEDRRQQGPARHMADHANSPGTARWFEFPIRDGTS